MVKALFHYGVYSYKNFEPFQSQVVQTKVVLIAKVKMTHITSASVFYKGASPNFLKVILFEINI